MPQVAPTYYDVHTHKGKSDAGVLQVVNAYEGFTQLVGAGGYCSIGLHPWYLSNCEAGIQEITALASQQNVVAIGECGLDKVCDTDWKLQVKVFRAQILLANTVGKPLVIHCVKAYNEILQIFREVKPTVPVIIHGFNKNSAIAGSWLEGGLYLSFGKAIFTPGDALLQVLKEVPSDQFFLETDSADISIADIYKKMAEIRQTSEEEIILQVRRNFKTVFGL